MSLAPRTLRGVCLERHFRFLIPAAASSGVIQRLRKPMSVNTRPRQPFITQTLRQAGYLRGQYDAWNCQRIGSCNRVQRWPYANAAAKSRFLTQKCGFLCVQWCRDWSLFLRNSLKRRLGFGIIGLELYWSVSGKVWKRAEMAS